jgi:sugar lactone lactonase YvrE
MAVALLAMACNKKKQTEAEKPKVSLKENYEVNSAGLYPEGLDFDTKSGKFVFGSIYKGAVYSLNIKGELETYASNNNLVAATGIFTDEVRNRLIVANSDLGTSQKSASSSSGGSVASIEVYDLSTKALLKHVDLKSLTPGAGAFANDITVDLSGNIYITDSFSPVIYKVDLNYTPSIFAKNDLFQPAPNAFGLNGIVYHADGYFLVSKTDNSKLFKISLSNPTAVSEVRGFTCSYPDGLEWNKDNELVAVENGLGLGKVFTFSSSDNWSSAKKVKESTVGKDNFPTAVTLTSEGSIYVVNSKLGKLLSGDATEANFTIQKVN